MMLEFKTTAKFRKDRKLMKRQGKDLSLLDGIISRLREQKPLEAKHRDHQLTGNFARLRECHIAPDWLLIYVIDKGKLILTAVRTGTHSDLLKM
jgi:mRNA interferase YafQ